MKLIYFFYVIIRTDFDANDYMKLTRLNIESSSGKVAEKIEEMMGVKHLMLVYEGEITQKITTAFTLLAENAMNKSSEDRMVARKVFHIMVESLQNIGKHADDKETGQALDIGAGLFIVGEDEESYIIVSGNAISNEKIMHLKNILTKVNTLDPEELKGLKQKQLIEGTFIKTDGAGVGLIDIARKIGRQIEYHFEPINDKASFLLLKIKINKVAAIKKAI